MADIIAAISTAQGVGGIGVIRVSGRDALAIGDHLLSCTMPLVCAHGRPTIVSLPKSRIRQYNSLSQESVYPSFVSYMKRVRIAAEPAIHGSRFFRPSINLGGEGDERFPFHAFILLIAFILRDWNCRWSCRIVYNRLDGPLSE